MYDLIIVGGGPVGSTLAVALRQSGLSILLLEARWEPTRDQRSLALSYGSRLILERIGAWPDIAPATAIESIHVSQRGGFGRALLTAADAGLPALGYVASYGAVSEGLARAASRCRNLDRQQGARANAIARTDSGASVSYAVDGETRSASARLVVLADGGALAESSASQTQRAYGQTAVVASVRADRPHANRAYERFTAQGPLALLPAGEEFALIWTTTPAEAARLCDLPEPGFLSALQACFGERAGRFVDVSARATYPLTSKISGATHQKHVLLLGNAAQTLHPVAGQGLNLGFRDAWELAQSGIREPQRIGDKKFIGRFLRTRHSDRRSTVLFTDLLIGAFSNDLAPLRWLRGCGLTLLDCLPPAKREFTARMIFGG